MTWDISTSCGREADKIAHLVVPYLQGRCLDLGCGASKVWPGLIGVDNGHHFGKAAADLMGDCTNLGLFTDASMDGIFSSHFLEHVRGELLPVLQEWFRVLKIGGHLCLYLPHKDLYPNIGEPGANPDHTRDLLPQDILDVMCKVGSWTLLENETRDQGNEYSFFQVYRKDATRACAQASGSFTPRFDVWNRNPRGQKRALVIRYGAFGDAIVASSILPGLKKQGYHITFNAKPSTQDVLRHDPHIDEWLIQGEDYVPNHALGPYWAALAERYDCVVNLCESVEGLLLTLPGRLNHQYSDETRRRLYSGVNYLEHTHDIAAVPHEFAPKFYPTKEELKWATAVRKSMDGPVIVWVINGSSAHKVYPFTQVVSKWLLERTPCHLVLYADPDIGKELQEGIMECLRRDGCDMGRVHGIAGDWKIRQSLTFATLADCVVGPETGPLNAVGMEAMPKVIYLSHSTEANLTKHWINTTTLVPVNTPCYPCHRLHTTWEFCNQSEETAAAMCASSIKPEVIFEAIARLVSVRMAA